MPVDMRALWLDKKANEFRGLMLDDLVALRDLIAAEIQRRGTVKGVGTDGARQNQP